MVITRRHLLVSAAGLASATISTATAGASTASTSTVTMWRLNPDWGFDLTTSTGATKRRCRSRACHAAAPNRFFLTSADAVAGRLHPCCLAQPEAVQVCIDLNELMPYYTARHGGVDLRCPVLPAALRDAMSSGGACQPPATTNPPSATNPSSATPASTPTDRLGINSSAPRGLAFTGGGSGGLAAAGAVALGLGLVARRTGRAAAVEAVAATPESDGDSRS